MLQIAPYASVIVNGIYWEPIYPRLLTTAQTTALQQRPDNRLLGIADISCDIDVRLLLLRPAPIPRALSNANRRGAVSRRPGERASDVGHNDD